MKSLSLTPIGFGAIGTDGCSGRHWMVLRTIPHVSFAVAQFADPIGCRFGGYLLFNFWWHRAEGALLKNEPKARCA